MIHGQVEADVDGDHRDRESDDGFSPSFPHSRSPSEACSKHALVLAEMPSELVCRRLRLRFSVEVD